MSANRSGVASRGGPGARENDSRRGRRGVVCGLFTTLLVLIGSACTEVSAGSVMGSPCHVPNSPPPDGYAPIIPAEAHVTSTALSCHGYACLTYRWDQASSSPAEAAQHSFCTCRCRDELDNPVPGCTCVPGFTCASVFVAGEPALRGSYCVRDSFLPPHGP